MTQEQRDEIKALNDRFNALHFELLLKKEYDLAREFSAVYHEVQKATLSAGMNHIIELYNL